MKSKRLERILSMIDKEEKIADIGADHGKLSYEIIKHNLADQVIATELNEKSIEKMRKSLEERTNERLVLRVGDGLEPLKKDEVDLVIIAGMGGNLIASILEKSYDKKFSKKTPQFIFQPVQFQNELRKYLYENNFHILDETIVEENEKFYHIIKSIKSSSKDDLYKNLKDIEFYYKIGVFNILKKPSCYNQYIEKTIEKCEEIYTRLKENNKDEKSDRLRKYIDFLRSVM